MDIHRSSALVWLAKIVQYVSTSRMSLSELLNCWIATMKDYQVYDVASKDWKQWQFRCHIKYMNKQRAVWISLANGFVRTMVSPTLDALSALKAIMFYTPAKDAVGSSKGLIHCLSSCGSLVSWRSAPLLPRPGSRMVCELPELRRRTGIQNLFSCHFFPHLDNCL